MRTVQRKAVPPVQRSLRTRVARLGLVVGSVVLLAGCSAHEAEAKMRFGWPTGVTQQAERMRVLWTWSSVAALVVGAITWGLIFWACIVYRKRDDLLPKQMKYHLPIEIAYTIAPFFVIAVLFYYTATDENYVNKLTPNPDQTITVTAFKWNWQFTYGCIGGESEGVTCVNHPYDGDHKDLAGKAENASTIGTSTEIPILVLPVDKKIRVIELSKDVVHSFWVPEFLFKRDVMPALKHPNEFEFMPTATGHFVGRCAELCGTYHSQMNFEVRVVSQADFDTYVKALQTAGPDDPNRQAEALAAIHQETVATTTYPFNTDRKTRSESKK